MTIVEVDDDLVTLVVPADGGYLGVLRTATAGLAARLSLTLDEIEDLRIAVDEACAMLLVLTVTSAAGADAPPTELTCQFTVTEATLSIEVSVPIAAGVALPGAQSFSWQVLAALAGEVSSVTSNRRAAIRMTKGHSQGRLTRPT
jgi:serine/threonine-protein kinase RsbW